MSADDLVILRKKKKKNRITILINTKSIYNGTAGNINSLAPGRPCDFKNVIFNLALLIGIFKSPYYNVFRWMPQDLADDKSTLVQVMAWCRQATGHYLNQCWPRSPMPYGVTRPQWVKIFINWTIRVVKYEVCLTWMFFCLLSHDTIQIQNLYCINSLWLLR